ncbi:DUF1604-domain-containing protein, partial [Saccharata proteae CBS 121410]
HKRPRAAFEADLQAAQSPFTFYGTPLPPRDDNVRDDGSYVPEWKQEVTDERGRKRLHGAFTGGFSAGYFNTVGSKEGWTPSTFVSSRANRAKDQQKTTQQRAEQYMDEEDLADAAEAQKLQTAGSFAGLGATSQDPSRRDALMGMVKTTGETMGVKLLQKMGWRQGQGVGPKVRRKARLDPDDDPGNSNDQSTHLFAPENSPMISFVRKNDHKGLGYAGEVRLTGTTSADDAGNEDRGTTSADDAGNEDRENEESDHHVFGAPKKKPEAKKPMRKGGIGMGVLNDTGSDEEDAYEMGPRISYNRVIGGDKKAKKKDVAKLSTTSANPLVGTKPVFIRKSNTRKPQGFRKCHDGRLPLDGFILATQALSLTDGVKYAPPKIPEGWTPSKPKAATTTPTSTAAPAATQQQPASNSTSTTITHTATSRASLLGETPLPGKSVFDFLAPSARARIAASTGKNNLPPALNEAPKPKTPDERLRDLWNLVPSLDPDIAAAALSRGNGGWMPYADDEGKRARYRAFLELRAGRSAKLPPKDDKASPPDWAKELEEFAHAAKVFRPMTGMMASRFTTSTSSTVATGDKGEAELLSTPSAIKKPSDPAEEAARLGMYGPMTRTAIPFYPPRIVCKRFNVPLPTHGAETAEAGGAPAGMATAAADAGAASSRNLEVVSKSKIEAMLREAPSFSRGGVEGGNVKGEAGTEEMPAAKVPMHAVVDVERNEALEGERAGEAVFKAIFGSDDDDD